jgi:hypothetical protein
MPDRLYDLLPAIYRTQDAAHGEPLRALLDIIEQEVLGPIEAEILALRDNATIESSADWAIPYIGDLLGVRPLRPGGPGNLRAYVANTLAYRRRKGSAAVIEQLARDVTGLPAHVVEYFELLATTQNDDHIRLHRPGTTQVRNAANAERTDGPFDDAPHTVEVRRATTRGGRYNIPNLGIFLWRLASFAVERGEAFQVDAGKFTFHPLGLDAPLFNRPQTETEITQLAEEQHVPEPLRRLALHAELELLRKGYAEPLWFGEQPVLRLFDAAALDHPPVEVEEIHICNLSTWRHPADGVAVDPQLGRIAFPTGVEPDHVLVSYAYGSSSDTGGGPAMRAAPAVRRPDWQVGVSLDQAAVGLETIHTSLADAIQEWNSREAGQAGVIVIMDSRSYDLGAQPVEILIKDGSQLLISAARWPALEDTREPGIFERPFGYYETGGVRPCLLGDLKVTAATAGNPGELILDGLLLSGQVTVEPGDLDSLRLRYCTLAPRAHAALNTPTQSIEVDDCPRLALSLERTITGPILVTQPVASLNVVESIVAGAGGTAVDAAATPATILATTILGNVKVRTLETSDSLYAGACTVERRQEGCARFSYFGPGSKTPRRYRCQPDLALAARAEAFDPNPLPAAEAKRVANRLAPHFVSIRYGDPGFAQLDMRTAVEIRTGAESGAEMGAFEHLKIALGELNLRAVLEEYLPFGLQAGIFFRS